MLPHSASTTDRTHWFFPLLRMCRPLLVVHRSFAILKHSNQTIGTTKCSSFLRIQICSQTNIKLGNGHLHGSTLVIPTQPFLTEFGAIQLVFCYHTCNMSGGCHSYKGRCTKDVHQFWPLLTPLPPCPLFIHSDLNPPKKGNPTWLPSLPIILYWAEVFSCCT